MEEEINKETREIRLVKIPLLAAASVFSPSLLLGRDYDNKEVEKLVNYEDREPLSKKELIRIFGESYPEKLMIEYDSPDNDQGIYVGIRLTKTPELSDILIRFKQENENKLIHLYERLEGGNRFYKEFAYNFKSKKTEYDDPERLIDKDVNTAPSIFRSFIDGEEIKSNFCYWGKRNENNPKKHGLMTHLHKDENGNEVMVGKITNDNPKLKNVEILMRHGFPEQIEVMYNIKVPVKILGVYTGVKVLKDINIKAVLTDSLDEDLFKV